MELTFFLLQRHQDGVVLVHFSEAEEADMCTEYMNQRYLAQRRLLAATWDGKTKYDVEETEEEREARLKKWVDYLESGDTKDNQSASGDSASGTGNGVSVAGNTGTSSGSSSSNVVTSSSDENNGSLQARSPAEDVGNSGATGDNSAEQSVKTGTGVTENTGENN